MLEERCCRIWDGVSETVASDIRVRDAGDVDLAAITQIYNAAIARRSATVLPAQITSSAISLLWAGITTRTVLAP
jgi:L-amino acid N-acyltransferase YncA